MKRLLFFTLVGVLSAGSALALQMEIYNSMRGAPVTITFASDKGWGVKADKPLYVNPGQEITKDVVWGISLAEFTVNGHRITLDENEGGGTYWRLELYEAKDESDSPMIQYNLFNLPKGGRLNKILVKEGLIKRDFQ